MKSSPDKSAEQRFRDAFDRLKKGNPKVLPYGTPVTQNNVAKEAGLTQGALRKSRFPLLIAEIQQYVGTHDQKRPSNIGNCQPDTNLLPARAARYGRTRPLPHERFSPRGSDAVAGGYCISGGVFICILCGAIGNIAGAGIEQNTHHVLGHLFG